MKTINIRGILVAALTAVLLLGTSAFAQDDDGGRKLKATMRATSASRT